MNPPIILVEMPNTLNGSLTLRVMTEPEKGGYQDEMKTWHVEHMIRAAAFLAAGFSYSKITVEYNNEVVMCGPPSVVKGT